MFRTHVFAIAIFLFVAQTSFVSGNPLGSIAHLLHRSRDSSYSEAYVLTLVPNKMAFDHKALFRGLNSVKNTIGRMSTFDSNEIPHLDNPLQLGFVRPPTLPTSNLPNKALCIESKLLRK